MTVTLSPKFQIAIPKEIHESLKLEPGQKIEVIEYENRIELVPIRPVGEMRGFVRGIDTLVEREEDRV